MKTVFKYLQQVWTASIRRQLMLGIILVHAVLMSIFVFDLVERQRALLHSQSVAQTSSLATTLATNSISWVLSNDVIGLEEILEAQINYPALRYAMVVSPEGRVLGHTEKDKVGLYVNDSVSRQLLTKKKEQIVLVNDDLSIDIASPIISNDTFIGWARVNLSQKGNEKNLQLLTRNGLLYTSLAIIIGALFAFFMARGITLGLKNIVDVAEKIKTGDQTIRADISRHDEIGKLGEDINIMLDTISSGKRHLQAIMDNSPTVIYVKDINGRFTFINKQFETLFHITRENIIGKTLHEVFPKTIADDMQRNDQDVLKVGHALESGEVVPQDDGMHTYVSNKFPLFDDNNNIYAVCGISTDMTDRIKIENERFALEGQLFHTQKMQAIGQLTGGVAHDFNNLLAVILGYTELSQEIYGKDNETLNDYLSQIYTAGIRGRDLIQQMMIFSRKDQSQVDIVPIKIEPILEETIGMLKATFPTTINIETVIQENLPEVKSNASLISQVLMNLCINAKDSMGKEGNLLITLAREKVSEHYCNACHTQYSGDYVVINIKDDGVGIDEDIIDRIFEPFFTSKKVGEGTGMGLSVVHGIVHKLGGHIVVTSSVGEGTNIKVLLPITNSKIENADDAEKNYSKIEYDFSNIKIMIVDDEPVVATLLKDSLTQCHAEVVVFTSSLEALAYFEKEANKIDLVITDQTMPELTGAALSEKLLAIRADVPIILCTGYSADITADTALQLGIKSFMEKPVKIDKLYSVINKLK